MAKTRREQIAEFLMRREATMRDVAGQFGLRMSDAVTDVDHVRRSYSANFDVDWARCSKCDFRFENRDKLTTPSRCPECRSERVEGPWFGIRRD